MAARSVTWDTGKPIPRTPFRHLIEAADTDGRFSAQSAVIRAGRLVHPPFASVRGRVHLCLPGPHRRSCRDRDLVVDEGGFLFKPRGIVDAIWNPTDVEAIVLEFISPAGFEGFFEEMSALQEGASRNSSGDRHSVRTNTAPRTDRRIIGTLRRIDVAAWSRTYGTGGSGPQPGEDTRSGAPAEPALD